MKLREQVTTILSRTIERQSLGAWLAQMSFNCAETGMRYERESSGLRQAIEFCFDERPRYEPTAMADIFPQVQLYWDPILPIITGMTSDMPAPSGFTIPLLFREQMRNLAPLSARQEHWFIYDGEQAGECVDRLRDFMGDWVIPFLNDYDSVDKLLRGYERGDERLPHDRRFYLCMCACYILKDKAEKALEILERKFGKPGLRRRYAQAFQYVSSLLS